MEFANKVALVTGAASGIGLATVRMFLKNGIKGVLSTDINSCGGEKIVQELRNDFGAERVSFFKLDTTDSKEYEEAFKKALEVFGKLDIVVNNVGIVREIHYQEAIVTNLIGTIKGTQLGLQYMGKDQNGNGGIIINISSMAGFQVIHTIPVYSATKSGIVSFVRALGHPFHYQRTAVRVVALCPGRTTPNIPTNKNISVELPLEHLQEMMNIINVAENQTPEVVGEAAVYIVKNAESGSVWKIESSKLYKLNIPDPESYSEFIMDFK